MPLTPLLMLLSATLFRHFDITGLFNTIIIIITHFHWRHYYLRCHFISLRHYLPLFSFTCHY